MTRKKKNYELTGIALSKGTSPGEKIVTRDLGTWLGHTPRGSVEQRKRQLQVYWSGRNKLKAKLP